MDMSMASECRGYARFEKAKLKVANIVKIVAIAHPRAVVIFTLTALIVAAIAERSLPPLQTTAALLLAMAAIQTSVGIFNDYYDRDLDAVAKPYRALPAGLVSAQSAYRAAWIAVALGLGAAATLGLSSMLVLALGAAMGFLYSARLKRSVLSWLPYAIAYPMVPLWVWVSLGKFRPEMFLIYPTAIPFSLGVHLCNQLRDYDDDTQQGMRGLTQHLGKQTASWICVSLLLLSPVPPLVTAYGHWGGAQVFLLSVLIHWLLIVHCLYTYRAHYGAQIWSAMFKRLQWSGPLMFIGWVLSVSR
jgi:4-hydroxybenzoate polyprenyltransferase